MSVSCIFSINSLNEIMFVYIIFVIISIFHLSFDNADGQCLTEFGFLGSPESTPSTYIYYYNGIEAQGGSSRFVFPQLNVSCYSKIDEITLLQGLPYACVKARTRYEFELWSQDPLIPGRYELVYRELLIYQQESLSTQITLHPDSDLLMAPGDFIGFRNSTLNFYSGVSSTSDTLTFSGSLPKHFACTSYSHLTLGEEVSSLGRLSPYFNFTLSPVSPNASEFDIRFDGNESNTARSLSLYHRGIYRPICHHFWHIRTADTLCQGANFSHAVIATTGCTPNSQIQSDMDISNFYWLDYLYCHRFQVDPPLCSRSSWECISNCSSVNQTAAASCAKEEGRTRFVLTEFNKFSNQRNQTLVRLSQFSDEFSDDKVPTVQVYYNGFWQELSADMTHSEMQRTAEIICRSHGYTDVYLATEFDREFPSNYTTVLNCTGSESDTSECTLQQQKSSNIRSSQLVLACSYREGFLSLYNNQSHDHTHGEVQYASNQTSSRLAFVCTDRWTAIESRIACSQMGYPTLIHYQLVSTIISTASQYSYYKHIDSFSIFQANFNCLGDELTIKECNKNESQNSNASRPLCQKQVVDLKCATQEEILSQQAECYDYKEILGDADQYIFGRANSSSCFFLFNLFEISGNINREESSSYSVSFLNFGRIVSVYGNYIRLTPPTIRSKRSSFQDTTHNPCFVMYFDSNGTAISVAGITNRTTNTYTTLYRIDKSTGLSLTDKMTNLNQPLNISSMSVICDRQEMSISSAYLISSGTELLTNVTYPPILNDPSTLQVYQSLLTPPTPVTTFIPNSSFSTNNTFESHDERIKILLLTLAGVATILSGIVFTFVCLLYIVRRHYKREILTLQVQSKAVVSSVYHVGTPHQLLDKDSNNDYVQQNVYYYKLKHQSDTRTLFIESTKSIRHTMHSVSIAPKFGLNMPEVNYVDTNSKRKRDKQDQWYIERDQLVYLREIGLGHYGKVQLMEAKKLYSYEKLPVAVKTLSTQDPVRTEQFMKEISLMMSLQNEYIVSLLGYCPPSRDATPLMVLEYLEYGDLKSLIVLYQDTPTARENELNILHLVSMAANIASAMVYLADNNYVHRDIAARNCLVGRQLVCKLSDFGLTLMTEGRDSNTLPHTGTAVPLKWTAPETFLSGAFSFKSDIWSYGVFLWEIFTYGCEPLDDLTKEELVSAIKGGTLIMPHIPDVPSFCNDLVQMCCFFNPEQRPSIGDIQSILEGVMNKIESEDSTSSYSQSNRSTSMVESTTSM